MQLLNLYYSDVTLKVKAYSPQEKVNMLFINCKTRDDKDVTCCGPITLHNNENKVCPGDVLELKNVQPHIEEKRSGSKFCLKMNGTSTVSIINLEGNSKKQIIPYIPTILPDPILRRRPFTRNTSIGSWPVQEQETKSKLLSFVYLL